MRPVRLDLDGFASYRQATSIDFTDADYFALVGPTGSGKSTLIDGIVFALYGTAPRWGRAHAIEYALAPTAVRATVRLVFDLGAHRYVVAREVRRVGRTIQQRTTSLERLLDPEDESAGSVVVAADPKAIREEIEHRIIGLSYDDFTQCVVLPQGQFADFLTAKTKDRQDILIKLLGADRYEKIRKAAAARAQEARTRAGMLTHQLESFQDATEEAVHLAHDRVQTLAAAQQAADRLGQELTGARAAAGTAARDLQTARDRHDQLRAIRLPDGLTEARQRAATTRAALQDAQTAAAEAVRTHDGVRADLDAAGDREQTAGRLAAWKELADRQAGQPALAESAAQATARLRARGRALTEAGTAVEKATAAERWTSETLTRHRQAEGELETRLATLTGVTVPADVPVLADRWGAATTARTQAQAEVDAAEAAEQRADEAASAGPAVTTLERALTLAQTLPGRRRAVATAAAAVRTAEQQLEAAAHRLAAAQAAEHGAGHALEQARTRDRARALRADLADGDPCPVCGGTVHDDPAGAGSAAPAGLDADEVATTRAHLEQAQAVVSTARERHAGARDTLTAAQAAHLQAEQRLRENETDLEELDLPPGTPHPPRVPTADAEPAGLRALLTQAQNRAAAVPAARARTRRARAALTRAQQGVDAAEQAGTEIRNALTRTLATLMPLGHDGTHAVDLAQAWQQIAAWAGARAASVRDELATARQQTRAAGQAAGQATKALDLARTQVEGSRAAAHQAEIDADRATRRHDEAAARIADLTRTLTGQPDQADTQAELDRVDALTAAERRAYAQVKAAAAEVKRAQAAATDAEQALTASRGRLREQVQAVHALGPPTLDLDDLPAAWSTLTGWAGDRADILSTRTIPDLAAASTRAQDAVRVAAAALAAQIAEAGLPAVTPLDPTRVQIGFADAAARAQVAHATLGDRNRERRRVGADLQTVTEQATVAETLEKLLRVNNFQKWLAGAALETLVVGASDALRELSGGQFDLTHENGEFYVIDHTDADAMRSVKTLSGGETFQASLALALTLSEHLSSLTTTGRATLDSIFLDEGFGTLDAGSVDVVAATLERLTQADRMVGIVTHVGSLADRVPVRYTVTRDAAGSRVVREDV